MGASASLIAKATPEQQEEINTEYERLKGEGIEEAEIETKMKEKYSALLEAIGESVELTYGMKDNLGWKLQFCCMISFLTSSTTDALSACAADAEIQIAEEPKAASFSVFGTPSAPSEGNSPPPAELTENRIFWEAQFEDKVAYDVDHKNRESNKAFFAKLGELAMDGDLFKSMAGSYMGKCWHLSRGENPSGASTAYSISCLGKTKDVASATELINILKGHGAAQLANEENALRFTIVRVSDGDMPGEKDVCAIKWTESWNTLEDYEAHKSTTHLKSFLQKISALMDPNIPVMVHEFAESKHFAK